MSHEIRTPLNAILGYAQILQRKRDLHHDVKGGLETIFNSGNQLLALINDILDISRIEVGQLELQETDFNLTALILGLENMFSLRCEQKGLAWYLDLEIDQNPLWVYGDEGKLRQILMNLLGNAVKFTDSGVVKLRISLDSRFGLSKLKEWYRKQEAGSRTSSQQLFTFEVLDTGIGISLAEQEVIFSPFTRGKASIREQGTGLGLAIAKRQVELMGGELALESEPGKGSRFFFSLNLPPAKEVLSSQTADLKHLPSSLAKGYKVKALIADDTQENLDVLSQILQNVGVEVITAENGQQAVEATLAD